MKILIAGATGNTGARLTRELEARGHEPVALVRDSSDTSVLPNGVATRTADLTDLPHTVAQDCEVVVFAAGSGGDTDKEMTEKVDRDGAIDLIDKAQACGARRFVMLSSVGAGDPDPDGDLAHYLEAKHAADEHLKASAMEYAILRPVALTDDGPTGSVTLGDAVDPKAKAARGDVAVVLADAVEDAGWTGRVALMQTDY